MRKRFVVATVFMGALAGGGLVIADISDPPETHTIRGSYAFDVTDPELVAGYSDALVVVTVLDPGKTVVIDGAIYTDFKVKTDEELKGAPPSLLTVRQTGGQDGEDVYVLEDQPLLRRGETYVVALTQQPGQAEFTLVAGPISAKPLPPEKGRQAEVVAAWRGAIANEREPS